MEVHPPHEPVHSWRDALIHIGLMTIGLFIALMLEAGVEYLHHKELVHAARENIRAEMEHNHQAAQDNLNNIQQEITRSQKTIDTIHAFQKNPKGHGSIEYHWNLNAPSDAAWRSARDTGALGYMPYAEVQDYAAVYGLQDFVVEKLQAVQFREGEALAPLMAQPKEFESMSPAEFTAMATEVARNYLDLQTIAQYMKSTDQMYEFQFKKQR